MSGGVIYISVSLMGFSFVIAIVLENSGVHCVIGGVKIDFGLDMNKNGALNEVEITIICYVCNGMVGVGGG